MFFPPTLFFVSVSLHMCTEKLLAWLARHNLPPSSTLMNLTSWRPRRDWSSAATLDLYGPSALYFLNIYYITGSFESFELLKCEFDGLGGQFLSTDPTIMCWTGQHAGYTALGTIGLFCYLLGVPGLYGYVLFVRLPRRGLTNKWNKALFGFLYGRFEPAYYWWEITEVIKKTVLVVAAVWFRDSGFLQCYFVMLFFGANLAFTFKYAPFKMYSHDIIDTVTSVAQLLMLTAAIGVMLRTSTAGTEYQGEDSMEWLEPMVFFVFLVALLVCVAVVSIDLVPLYQQRRAAKLRKEHKGLTLPDTLLELSFCDYALLEYAERATPEAMGVLVGVEVLLRQHATPACRGSVAESYATMAVVYPRLLDWALLDEVPNAPAAKWRGSVIRERASLAAADETCKTALCLWTHSDRLTRAFEAERRHYELQVPSIYIIGASMRGGLLHWLCEKASQTEREKLGTFLSSLHQMLLERQQQPRKALLGRVLTKLTQTDERQEAIAEAVSQAAIALHMHPHQSRVSRWESLRKVHYAHQLMAKIRQCGIHFEEWGEQGLVPKARRLLKQIAEAVHCETLMLIPVSSIDAHLGEVSSNCVATDGSTPASRAADKARNASKEHADWSLAPHTPAGLCLSTGKVVVVENVLFDNRFDKKLHRPLGLDSMSQVCIPIFSGTESYVELEELHSSHYDHVHVLKTKLKNTLGRPSKDIANGCMPIALKILEASQAPATYHATAHSPVCAVLKCINKKVSDTPTSISSTSFGSYQPHQLSQLQLSC